MNTTRTIAVATYVVGNLSKNELTKLQGKFDSLHVPLVLIELNRKAETSAAPFRLEMMIIHVNE